MRRTVTTVLATLVALVAVPTPAQADDTVVIDHLYSEVELPENHALAWEKCDGSSSGTSWIRLEPGPSSLGTPEDPPTAPPLGDGSLELETPATNDVAGLRRLVPNLAELAVLDLWAHDPELRGEAVIRVTVGGAPFGTVWTGRTQLVGPSFGPAWKHITDLMTRSWTWTTPPGPFNPEPVPFVGTVDDFVAANGSGPASVTVQRQRCSGAGPADLTTHIDALTIAMEDDVAAGDVTTFDFEAPEPFLIIGTNRSTISIGESETIFGEIYHDEEPFEGATVRLMSSTDGIDWTEVTTRVVPNWGGVGAPVSPVVTTHYRWDFVDVFGGWPAASSPVTTLTVKRPTSLSISASSTTITSGDPVTLGATLTTEGTPARDRALVLRQSTDGGTTWVDAASVLTGSNGTAQVTRAPSVTTRYRWHFLGSDTLEPAMSDTRTITVRKRTTITANVAPTVIDYGETATVGGLLTVGGPAAPPGLRVELWTATQTGAFTLYGSTITGADGRLSTTVAPTQLRRYQWRYGGGEGIASSISPIVTVSVRRPTSLTMSATPLALLAGRSTTFTTSLRSAGNPMANAPVLLERSTDGGTTWTRVVTRTTDVAGAASYVHVPAGSAQYRWRFARTATDSQAISPARTVTVSYSTGLSMHTTAHQVPDGGSATLSTVLGAAETSVSQAQLLSGRPVTLRSSIDDGRNWSEVGTVVTNDQGLASLVVTPSVETLYEWRFAGSGDFRASRSPTTRVAITPPPTPTEVAIELVADGDDEQIYDGQTARVGGTLTAGAVPRVNRTLILERSTDGGTSWVQVTTRVTNGAGQVSAEVAPTATVAYRWRFAGAGPYLPSTSPTALLTVTPLTRTSLSNSASPTSIVARYFTQLTTFLTAGESPVPGATVTLQRRPAPGSSWSNVLSATTDATGRAAASVTQEVNTAYRWVYPGSVSTAATTSPTVNVQAKFLVVATIEQHPGVEGDDVIIRGSAHRYSGAGARLMQRTPTGPIVIGSASMLNDGTFRITQKMSTPGTFSLFVEIPADGLNAAGRTPDMTVVVPPHE